jgi:hypothetical protein
VSEGRLNDLDVLGPPRSCRRLPGSVWLAAAILLLVLVAVAVVGKALL